MAASHWPLMAYAGCSLADGLMTSQYEIVLRAKKSKSFLLIPSTFIYYLQLFYNVFLDTNEGVPLWKRFELDDTLMWSH